MYNNLCVYAIEGGNIQSDKEWGLGGGDIEGKTTDKIIASQKYSLELMFFSIKEQKESIKSI